MLDQALDAARAGDADGFRVLWMALNPPLVRFLSVRDHDAAEDLASETWLQVIRDWNRFKGDAAGFRGWLFSIARNRAIDAARASARRPTVPLETELLGSCAPAADHEAEYRLSTAAALQLVRMLPTEQADIVALRVIAGLDVDRVGEILHKSPGAVRVSCHRGLLRLREILVARSLVGGAR